MAVWLGELLVALGELLVGLGEAVVDWLGEGIGRTNDENEENELHESRPLEE